MVVVKHGFRRAKREPETRVLCRLYVKQSLINETQPVASACFQRLTVLRGVVGSVKPDHDDCTVYEERNQETLKYIPLRTTSDDHNPDRKVSTVMY